MAPAEIRRERPASIFGFCVRVRVYVCVCVRGHQRCFRTRFRSNAVPLLCVQVFYYIASSVVLPLLECSCSCLRVSLVSCVAARCVRCPLWHRTRCGRPVNFVRVLLSWLAALAPPTGSGVNALAGRDTPVSTLVHAVCVCVKALGLCVTVAR